MEKNIKMRRIIGANFHLKEDFFVPYDLNNERSRQAYEQAEARDPQNTSPNASEATPAI